MGIVMENNYPLMHHTYIAIGEKATSTNSLLTNMVVPFFFLSNFDNLIEKIKLLTIKLRIIL
jgi:hypothetical protein